MRKLLCTSLMLAPIVASAADPAWLELAPAARVIARTAVEATCPQIIVDGKASRMKARKAGDADNKNAAPAGQRLVCEADVTGARKVKVAATALKMPRGTPQRIVVIGDTGCRIKIESVDRSAEADFDAEEGAKVKVQDCNDSTQWPFKAVAAAAAATQPDLVIHVGDYVYRESTCPIDRQAGCGGSPWGDNWNTWDADFFTPARPLLAAAPWIFVRGNHEICKRAGKGWLYYLDPYAYSPSRQCADDTAPYAVKLGRFQAWVLDSSNADDYAPASDRVAAFTAQFRQAASLHLSHALLLSHRPIWAAKAGQKSEPSTVRTLSATLQQAWAAAPIPGVDLIVAGHTHRFELLSFRQQQLPPQAVIGNSGTKLEREIKTSLEGQSIGEATVANASAASDFGYAVVTPLKGSKGWSLRLHDPAGKRQLTCSIAKHDVQCHRGRHR
jgi:predicted phosphodiesterase